MAIYRGLGWQRASRTSAAIFGRPLRVARESRQ